MVDNDDMENDGVPRVSRVVRIEREAEYLAETWCVSEKVFVTIECRFPHYRQSGLHNYGGGTNDVR